jgi:hypothetical protein
MLFADFPQDIVLVANNVENAGVYKVPAHKMNETIKVPELDGNKVSLRKTEWITAEVSV